MRSGSVAPVWKGRNTAFLVVLGLVAALGLTFVATTIASSRLSRSGGVAEAKGLVKSYEQPISLKWRPPGKPFDTAKAKGKLVFFVSVGLSIPFEQELAQGIKNGVASVGAKMISFDGKFSAVEYSRGIEQGIQTKASVIVIDGIEPNLVGPALADAKKAGIPVIMTDVQDWGPPRKDYGPAVVAHAEHRLYWPARAEADFITADSSGKANIIFITSSDLGLDVVVLRNLFLTELKRVCAGCSVKTVDVPSAQWSTLTTKTASLIRSNPHVNYFVPVFDGMATFMLPGIHSAGAQNRVKLLSFNATPSVLQSLKKHDVVAADVGNPNLWLGWSFADQTLRVLTGNTPVANVGVPNRLFTKNNIGKIDLSAQESNWYGKTDFKTLYKKLWGVR
jgi:ribose transport system substrate-binding protein